MNSLYSKELRDARISVRMKQVGSGRYREIINSIKEYIRSHLDTTILSWHITGIVPLLINVQDNILWSEIPVLFARLFIDIYFDSGCAEIGQNRTYQHNSQSIADHYYPRFHGFNGNEA